MTAALLEVRELGVTYGDICALRTVTFAVPAGAHVTWLGPSGAGKSTLLRAIAGLVRPATGSICWGQEVWSDAQHALWVPPEHRRIGMVAQDPALWSNLKAAEHLALALRWRGVRRAERPSRIEQLLAQVQLTHRAGHRPEALSGGEAQRLALARALAGGSRWLLLDEPLGQLDAELRPAVALEIQRITRAAGATVLHVTHDPAEAFSLGDQVGVLEAGELVQLGSPGELAARPCTRFVAWATGYRNLVPAGAAEAFGQALGLDAATWPWVTLKDGTLAFRPCDLRLDGAATGRRLVGHVTRLRFDGIAWSAVVRVWLAGVELELESTSHTMPNPGTRVGLCRPPAREQPTPQ